MKKLVSEVKVGETMAAKKHREEYKMRRQSLLAKSYEANDFTPIINKLNILRKSNPANPYTNEFSIQSVNSKRKELATLIESENEKLRLDNKLLHKYIGEKPPESNPTLKTQRTLNYSK